MRQERRRAARQKLDGPELLEMGTENGGLVVDVSEDGLGFQLVSPIEQNRTLNFAFSLGSNQLVRAQGRVAWISREGKAGGITFTALPNATRHHLNRWLGRMTPDEPPEPAPERGETKGEAPPAPERAETIKPPVLAPERMATISPTPLAPERTEAIAPPPTPSPVSRPSAVIPSGLGLSCTPGAPFDAPAQAAGDALFARASWQEDVPGENAGHRKTAAVIVVALFLVAGFAVAQMFPSAFREVLSGFEGIPRAMFGAAKTRAAQPKAPAPGAQPAAPEASATPTGRASAAAGRHTQAQALASAGMNPFAAKEPSKPIAGVLAPGTGAPGESEYRRGEEYLSGRKAPRDPAQAAHWFWLAESNGYTPATVALAELYLNGDGVERSCLQARILLTAAMKENNKEAASKLRQLPENCE